MKIHWKTLSKKILLPAICIGISFSGFSKTKVEPTGHQRIPELDDMSFIEMLTSVDVGKNSELIQKFQDKEGKNKLLNGKYNPEKTECKVEKYRNKEVLVITIPAHLLFAPNETELKKGAEDYLNPLKRYLKMPDMYRVLLVMHTDNTGSEQYRDQLTLDRVDSVFEWFEDNSPETTYLFSYGMGDDQPLKDNDSFENRRMNRRLEVYLVPGEKMVQAAEKGRIAF